MEIHLIVVPISDHQDTVGAMCRSLADSAALLSVIAGPDPNDNFTLAQPLPVPNFSLATKNPNALRGARIGIPRRVFLNDSITGNDPSVNVMFEQAIKTIKSLGATVIDPADLPSAEEIAVSNNETFVLNVDFKVGRSSPYIEYSLLTRSLKIQLAAYFGALKKNPSGVRTLADLIAFNNKFSALEEPVNFTDQSQ